MKRLLTIALFAIALLVTGCKDDFFLVDLTPPSPPTNLGTSRGDNSIIVSWSRSPERDVAGYNIYVSNSFNGKYVIIGHTTRTSFNDIDAQNGITYYYAVTAYDADGNESDLSRDLAYDTPRPEGANIQLFSYRNEPGNAGYDFSTYSIGDYNDAYTDVYYEYYQGDFYLNVWKDSDIQDMGYTSSLYQINEAPSGGWSPTKDAIAYAGHTYVIRTWDNHYAKIRVVSVSSSRVLFDWTYQLQKGNPELKVSVKERGALEAGSGTTNRM